MFLTSENSGGGGGGGAQAPYPSPCYVPVLPLPPCFRKLRSLFAEDAVATNHFSFGSEKTTADENYRDISSLEVSKFEFNVPSVPN